MAYRASTYRPGYEDEPNPPTNRSIRGRSPRRNGRRSSSREASAGQAPRRVHRNDKRSRSPDGSSPKSGTSRKMSDLEKRKKDNEENYGQWRQADVRQKGVLSDREWSKFQAPVHARIAGYADEIIRNSWQWGDKVTKESSPRFAVEVLLYVRKRFYTEVAKNAAEARAAGYEPKLDPPNGPYTQKLVLENMRWLFNSKVKPLTEQYIKEPFLCHCSDNGPRFYGLESILQHYASKHISTLSNGIIVVDWKAEWPEHPPFNPKPDVVINTCHSVAPSNGERADNERHIRVTEATEGKESEYQEREVRDKEAEGYKRASSDNQGRDGGVSSSRPILQDIHNIPQTDRPSTIEHPERNTSPQTGDSVAVAGPRSSSIRLVKISNMDLDGLDSRTSQRLHLVGLFTRFMSEVSEQTAMQLRRDSAKKTLEQKSAAYDKAQVLQKEFPSAEESTRASKERAQKEFESVEKELVLKREASVKLSEEISEIVYPNEEPSDLGDLDITGKVKHLEDKLAQCEGDLELFKNKQQQLDQLCSTLMTERDKQIIIESIGNGFNFVQQKLSPYFAKTSTLEAEMAQLKQCQNPTDLSSSIEELSSRVDGLQQRKPSQDTIGLKSTIDTLSSRLDELQNTRNLGADPGPRNQNDDTAALKSTMDSLSSRLDDFEAIRLELSKAVELINSTLAVQSAAINDRSEMQSVHTSINELSRSENGIRTDLAKFQAQMQSFGKELRTIKMVQRGHRPLEVSVDDTTGLSNEYRRAIHDEIRAQQEAVDVILDGKFGDLEGQSGDLKGQIETLGTQFVQVDSSLTDFRNRYTGQVDLIAMDVTTVKGDINSIRDEIKVLRQNDIHSLQLACSNLDYRMNNLSTEHLARQILGQLDAHIRGGEKNIAILELRMQELEKRAVAREGPTAAKREIEESVEKVRKDLIDAVDARLDTVHNIFTEVNNELVKELMQLRNEVNTSHSTWQKVKADVEASKTNIVEAIGSLRAELNTATSKIQTIQGDLSSSKIGYAEATKSLKADVQSISLALQTAKDHLGATKNSCEEATASLKVEIAKATRTISPEKRKLDSPGPVKTNGHKRRRPRRSVSDTDEA